LKATKLKELLNIILNMRKSIRIGIFSKARVKEINTFIIISSEKISNELKEFKLESEINIISFLFFLLMLMMILFFF